MANSRASKNIAMSGGKSIGKLIVGGLKKVKNWYVTQHKKKQDMLDKYGTSTIFK
jgi:hypothetical protein